MIFVKHTPMIVLTGGPCGGKTTVLSYLRKKLMDSGYRVFIVPEVATIVISGGVYDMGHLAKNDPPRFLAVQCVISNIQIGSRRAFNELARIAPGDKKVILLDRGDMDLQAYVGEAAMKYVMAKSGLTLAEARDSFDGVIHLTTAALGAENFYTLANNAARHETLDEARVLDEKTAAAWVGTPHLRIIDNSTDFDGKKRRAHQAVCHILGLPVPLEIERKFLLPSIPDLSRYPELGRVVAVDIEQIYLTTGCNDHSERRVRRRGTGSDAVYFETLKREVAPGVRQESERLITAEEYERLKEFRDPSRHAIRKKRHCFIWRDQYYELDIFSEPKPLALLEIELTEQNQRVNLPPMFSDAQDVTYDSRFSNFNIASK